MFEDIEQQRANKKSNVTFNDVVEKIEVLSDTGDEENENSSTYI